MGAAKGINTIKENIDAAVASFFTSCVHCGMCADACPFYVENPQPENTPIYKLEPMKRIWQQEYTLLGRLKKLIGLSKKITDEELSQWAVYAYDNCSMCGRCSIICPAGNDIARMIRKMREGLAVSGHAPEGVVGAVTRAINTGSPMGLKFKALQAQIRHITEDSGFEIPLDKKGADYMVLLSSLEIINFPEVIEAMAKIFSHADVSWTVSSKCFEATNAGVQIGVSDLAGTLVQRVVDAAIELEVKTVISPECGHAYQAIRWEGPNILGYEYPFAVQHILEVLDGLNQQGRLNFSDKETTSLTYHDPCQIARKGGVIDEPRNLLSDLSTNFVEMKDNSAKNWCCGGGGGVSSNERANKVRLQAFLHKKKQIEETGAKALVTACANCRMQIEEGLEVNSVEMPVLGLTEMVAAHLESKND